MKKLLYSILVATTILFTACSSDNSKTESPTQTHEQQEPILNVKSFIGKSRTEVDKLLGKAQKTEKVKGYPCQKSKCERVFYKNDKYEVIFKKGKVDRITINKAPDLTNEEHAIEKLGLPVSKSSAQNPGNFIRWSSIEGIHEINFFSDYIYIIVNPAD